MPKCPLKNFEECIEDCAWCFDDTKSKNCAIKLIANTNSLAYLSGINNNLYNIATTLKGNNTAK